MRRALVSMLAVIAIALAVWSCREQLVSPGTGNLPGTARTLRIAPSRLDLKVGGSANVTATLLDGTGSEIPMPPGFTLTYTSSATEVFTTDVAGVTTAVAAGEGVLRVAVGALAVGIPVSVVSIDPRFVIVSGDAQTGAPGTELDLPLVMRAEGPKGDPARGVVVDFDVKEGTLNPERVTTNDEGIATVRWTLGKTVGVQSITATSKGYTSVTFAATAVVRPVARVVVSPDTVKLTDVAQTGQLTATARDSAGKDLPAGTFTWKSSNPAVATVTPTGLVTAVGEGSSTVTASLSSIDGTSTVLVTLPVPQSRLAFRPDTLRAAVVAGGEVVAAVAVIEAGGLPLASLGTVSCNTPLYEGSPVKEWLTVQSCGDSVRVLVQAATLPSGTWRANIPVRGTLASNSPATLPVEVVVTAAPVIAALPSGALTITSTLGADNGVFNRAVEISNGGGGTLSGLALSLTYAAGQPVGWIENPKLDSAQAPTVLRFTARRGALSIGTYDATVHLTSTATGVQPLDIPVHLVVKSSAARLGLSADSVEGVSYTNGPSVRVAVDVVERNGLGDAALGTVTCSAIIPAENQKVISCGDSIVVLLNPGGNLVGSEVATVRVSSAFTADTVTLRVTRTAARPQLRLVPDSLAARSPTSGAAVRVAADLVIDVLKGAPAYPEASLGALTCTVQAPAGAPQASVAQCGDSIAIVVTPGVDAGTFRYLVDVQAPNATVTAVRASLPINFTITAAAIPIIAVSPASPLTVNSTIAADDGVFNRVVEITNAGGGTLAGLAASLTYATGQPVGWIESLALDSAKAPTALRFTIRRGALSAGTYDATVHLTSTVAGTQPLDIAVRIVVLGAARLGLSPDSVEAVGYTNGPAIRVAVDVVERTGLGKAALGLVSCSAPRPSEFFTIISCGDSIVAMLSPGGNLVGSEVAIVHVTSAFTTDTVALRLTRTGARPKLRMRPDSLAAQTQAGGAPIRAVADLVIDVLPGAPAYPEPQLGALTCTVQAPAGAPSAIIVQCADSIAIAVTPGADAGAFRYTVDIQAPNAAVTALPVVLPINVTITAAPVPVIAAFPSGQLTFNTTYGADNGVFNRVVDITNTGGGTLSGLTVSVTYTTGQPTGWIENPAFDAPTAPTALRFTFNRGSLPPGTYDATVRLTSSVAGVQPLDIPVRMVVIASAARIGLSPDSMRVRSFTNGAEIRAAVAVIERTGLGNAALGTISCSAIKFSAGKRWARIARCADSVVVFFDTDLGVIDRDSATIRVTGSTISDTATLRLRFTVVKPRLAFVPDSLTIATTAGHGSVEDVVEVVEAEGWLTSSDIRDLRCTLTTPSGAPPATVTSCFTDAVTVRVAPDASVGRFVYTVLVEAPNAIVGVTPGVLRVAVTISALPKPFAGAVIYGTCAIDTVDKLYCWGKNSSGEVGDGSLIERDFPTPVKSSLALIVKLHSGNAMKCGLNVAPLIPVCWGQNATGATGQGTFSGVTTAPSPVANFSGTSSRLGVGPQTACAQEDEADLWFCWGDNTYGLLGNGSTESATNAPGTPVAFAQGSVNDIAIGARHACAIGTLYQYTLYCWGDGSLLGNGSTDTGVQSTPVAIPFPDDLPATGLVATTESTCLLSYTSYRLFCWGGNRDGTTGTGGPILISTPTQVHFPGFPDQVSTRSVVAGDHHICAIVGGGTYCWGRNEYGQLGTGDFESSSRPVRIANDLQFESLAASGSTTCGRTYDNNVWCWGYGLTGELGNGKPGANSPVMVQVFKQ